MCRVSTNGIWCIGLLEIKWMNVLPLENAWLAFHCHWHLPLTNAVEIHGSSMVITSCKEILGGHAPCPILPWCCSIDGVPYSWIEPRD
jgi:hypothetical protein